MDLAGVLADGDYFLHVDKGVVFLAVSAGNVGPECHPPAAVDDLLDLALHLLLADGRLCIGALLQLLQ